MSPSDPSAPAPGRPELERVVVLVPTYNERENLPGVLERLRDAVPQVDVCVVDDGSPDGTGDLADEYAARDPQVHVLHRSAKEGLGAAYLAGFRWALHAGYDAIVEMDADGSHRPEDLPALLAAAADADVVIGSRWVRGGEVLDWPPHRRALSVGANLYVRVLLGMPVRDATAGFRVYRAGALETMGLTDVASQGYCFQVDLTWRAAQAGLRIVEVPIVFVERELGASKMSGDVVAESLVRVAGWSLSYRGRRIREAVRRRRTGPARS
ncbi:polyprenol monophosphomannose synthase [Agilicoccus flavus]|uniref:polyprenol monophosphomannose synthase n=1 Tax=Agilicoccus flavus TaxID=2775968 RepID=UPI001CF66779|nr:polyprenol monophosphomannose synthase [Agilicoccus flavus]